MDHRKQIEAAEESLRASIAAQHDTASYMTVAERDKAERIRLYYTLKERNALDIYYYLYPDERPKGEPAKAEQERGERERER